METACAKPNYHRKRKKSFLTRQRHYGKKGKFGRGFELSEDLFQYFIRIFEVAKATESAEDREVLASNTLEEISGKEVDTCSNQLASRVVEELLNFAPDANVISLGNVFGSELRLVFTDPYCSHVLQRLIVVLCNRILDSQNSRSEKTKDDLKSSFTRIAMFALNNIEDFIFDSYANHCLRTLFACVNGRAVKEDFGDAVAVDPVPEEFENLTSQFVKRIVDWPQFNDLALQVLPSGCLQALIISLRNNPKLVKKLLKKVLEVCKSQEHLDLTDDKYKSLLCLIEAAVVVAPLKTFSKMYERLFRNKLRTFALSKNCNFVVQKLLLHCHTKEMFENLFEELADSFDEILRVNFAGVLLALAKGCRRLKSKEGDFSKTILTCLHCDQPPDRRNSCLPIICCLTPFESYNPDSLKITLLGSLVVQEMLFFTKPIMLVNSLLGLDDKTLIGLLSDQRGCHVTDAFCTSTFVGEKNREKLFRRLQTRFATLAESKHGSRSFDAVWGTLNKRQKVIVMEELKSSQSALLSTQSGRIIAIKVKLDLFRQDKEQWIRQPVASDSNKFNKNKEEK